MAFLLKQVVGQGGTGGDLFRTSRYWPREASQWMWPALAASGGKPSAGSYSSVPLSACLGSDGPRQPHPAAQATRPSSGSWDHVSELSPIQLLMSLEEAVAAPPGLHTLPSLQHQANSALFWFPPSP